MLGLARHDAKVVAGIIPEDFALGVLDETFGDIYPALHTILKKKKLKILRVHLIDGTCIRNKVCEKGAPGYKNVNELISRAVRLKRFMSSYPNTRVLVSPFLEHDEQDKKLVTSWFKAIAQHTDFELVCNPFTGYCPKKVGTRKILRESHGCNTDKPIVSPDGVSGFDCNNFTYGDTSEIEFSWIPQNNGRFTGDKKFTMPKERRKANFTNRNELRQQIVTLRDASPQPMVTGCPLVKRPELYKTNAEYYGRSDYRGNKGLFISQLRTENINIHRLDGTKIGTLVYKSEYSGGGYRYYIGERGGSGQNPLQLMRQLGGEWGLLRSGSYCRLFNAVRRVGYYRE